MHCVCLIWWVCLSICCTTLQADSIDNLTASTQDMTIENGLTDTFFLRSKISLEESAVIDLFSTNQDMADTNDKVVIPANDTSSSVIVTVFTNRSARVGHIVISMNTTDSQLGDLSDVFVRVTVVHSLALNVIIIVVGWIYFAAWTISFYPQVYLNFKRKSVEGLNFDFLAYNLTGFTGYAVFNIGMFWIAYIKDEYSERSPFGVNPVLINDVFFTLHAVLITMFTIFQCLIYDRGGQKVSRICILLSVLAWLFLLITLIITAASHEQLITWLDFFYYFSYIKLGVSVIKYIPQAWMNFRRKSTVGWSIGNVLLDFTGGSFSLLQMFLLSYNNDDWGSIFGDPTKFGLGLFSVLFDILFIIQHYILYRGKVPVDNNTEKEELLNNVSDSH